MKMLSVDMNVLAEYLLGMIVMHFAWMVHRFASSRRLVR